MKNSLLETFSLKDQVIVITGGAGFIASNYLYYWAKNHPNDNLIVIDNLTYAGNISNIQELTEFVNLS